ncbi:aldo-keto reductase-like protein [Eremomyces bilateralis CBS 781.70]|uniref:Aldo-keto reductase-like protein n=1 Tax=Eremomyces bilateralis CBS 781.70 TaxID=1392243 RepID=A0A6G1GAS2_9PEZI|nr:aldo-keto reductase-like protein [Eremomyces bilateralis CBS 781.70]KAF1815000.1 aldo-keto reductase-like protein [Eremomyces bilateralis CBS 781.70]
MAGETVATALAKAIGRPAFIYGTAWKKAETTRLVQEALASGFTAVDTAAQPKHYREDLVGKALRNSFESDIISRERLFLQTKFTAPGGQSLSNIPYNPDDELQVQIETSVKSSFRNLRPREETESENETYIDCLLLHSPLDTLESTVQAWKVLESYVPKRIRHLGISNVDLQILQGLYDSVEIKPAVVQNRFIPMTGYDVELREFCADKGIMYESFWTLTGNPNLLRLESVQDLAAKVRVAPEVGCYALVMALGITTLNGTTSTEHMKDDLAGVLKVQEWASEHPEEWQKAKDSFRTFIGAMSKIDTLG